MEKNSQESVFARPARWVATVPAVLAGAIAGLSVLYSLIVLPSRLPSFYLSSLERAQAEYSQAIDSGDFDAVRRTAGNLNVIYNRLVLIEAGKPDRYWQWAEFSSVYASQLENRLERWRDELPEEDLNEIQALISTSRDKAQDTFEYLSHTETDLNQLAFINFVDAKVERGMAEFMFPNLSELLPRLRECADSQDPQLVQQSVPLYLQVGLETVWQNRSRANRDADTLGYDLAVVQQLSEVVRGVSQADYGPLYETNLKLLSCLQPSEPLLPATDSDAALALSVESSTHWKNRLAQTLDGVVGGDWNDVAFLLARKNSDNPEAVRLGTARWICRLATSELAKRDPAWREGYSNGLQIVSQIAPQLPEFNQLLWSLAAEHRDARKSNDAADDEASGPDGQDLPESAIPTELVQAVIGGDNIAIRHIVLGLSSFLSQQPELAKTHFQLAQRSGGSLMAVGQAVLYQLRLSETPDEELFALAEILTDVEPGAGFNWYVRGVVASRLKRFDASVASLEKALELLGDVPQISQLRDEVQEAAKRAAPPGSLAE